MSDPSLVPLIDLFGPNAGYAYEKLIQYRTAPASLEASWRSIFEGMEDHPTGSVPAPAAPGRVKAWT